MGHYFIVGFDVELDDPMKGREAVQRMKVEPTGESEGRTYGPPLLVLRIGGSSSGKWPI
jgi:hypothetical protein